MSLARFRLLVLLAAGTLLVGSCSDGNRAADARAALRAIDQEVASAVDPLDVTVNLRSVSVECQDEGSAIEPVVNWLLDDNDDPEVVQAQIADRFQAGGWEPVERGRFGADVVVLTRSIRGIEATITIRPESSLWAIDLSGSVDYAFCKTF